MNTDNDSVRAVDELAQFIRQIDGAHTMGAGALAERIVEWQASRERYVPRWIPVSERVPDTFIQTVLVSRDEDSTVPCVAPAIYNGDDFMSLTIAGPLRFVQPTHWCELPEYPANPNGGNGE